MILLFVIPGRKWPDHGPAHDRRDRLKRSCEILIELIGCDAAVGAARRTERVAGLGGNSGARVTPLEHSSVRSRCGCRHIRSIRKTHSDSGKGLASAVSYQAADSIGHSVCSEVLPCLVPLNVCK